jgi:hypothetical protein
MSELAVGTGKGLVITMPVRGVLTRHRITILLSVSEEKQIVLNPSLAGSPWRDGETAHRLSTAGRVMGDTESALLGESDALTDCI